MNTASLTRALRKSELVEYRVLEKDRFGKSVRVQQGWYLHRHNDRVTIHHSKLNNGLNWEFDHDERKTAHYELFMLWVQKISEIVSTTGHKIKIIEGEYRFGRFNQHKATIIREIEIVK